MYKRKSSLLIEEEEDEWEREASSSKKRLPPNLFTRNIDILDEQYNVLSDTTTSLEQQLKSLQSTLKDLEIEEEDLTKERQLLNSEYIQLIETTVSTINLKDEEQANTSYTKSNEKLCNNLKYRLNQWDKVFELMIEQEQSISKKIKKLAHEYRYTEFDVIDLTAQIEGLETYVRSLGHETLRLNALPQILPILKSETDNYKAEMRNTTELLGKLEQETIKPALIELSELKIVVPLNQVQLDKSVQYMKLLIEDLERIFDTAIKQRSIQSFISCLNQIKEETSFSSIMLEKVTDIIENNVHSLSLKDKEENNDLDTTQLQLINELLDQFIESKQGLLFNQSTTLVDKIHALKDYKIQLENKWSQDFNSCLDAIEELDGLRSRLSDTLFADSKSNKELILLPESYTTLQTTFESDTKELKTRIEVLKNEIENPDTLFEKHRKLFSTFYTDPDKFLDLIEKNKTK